MTKRSIASTIDNQEFLRRLRRHYSTRYGSTTELVRRDTETAYRILREMRREENYA